MAMNDLTETIRSGKHLGWNELVRQLLSDRTAKMGLRARKAAVIVLYRNDKGWSPAVFPLTTQRPFDQIASCCRETRATLRGPAVQPDDSLDLAAPNDAEQALELAMFPIGLVVVGTDQNGEWADELGILRNRVVNELLSKPGVANELKTLTYTWASDEIRKLVSSKFTGPGFDTVTDADTGDQKVILHIASLPTDGSEN